MRSSDSIIDSVGMNLSKLGKIVEDRGARHNIVHGVAKSQTQLSHWTTTLPQCMNFVPFYFFMYGCQIAKFIIVAVFPIWNKCL